MRGKNPSKSFCPSLLFVYALSGTMARFMKELLSESKLFHKTILNFNSNCWVERVNEEILWVVQDRGYLA